LACWDADRLDLGRVGITPDPRRLGTKAGRNLLAWAHVRAVEWHEPTAVLASWGWKFSAEPGAADVTMNVKRRLQNDGTV
jgi:hypothetical protein